MKTSNKLFISLLIIVFLAMLGSSMVLKSEFEKIDRNDPYYGYSQENLQPFKAVKIKGHYPWMVQLEHSEVFEIRTNNARKTQMDWKINGDTLEISLQHPDDQQTDQQNEYFYRRPVGVYIMAPQLSGIHSEGITCRISGLREEHLNIKTKGNKQSILLSESNVDRLFANIAQGGLLLLKADSRIGIAQVQVRDSSAFTAEYDVIDSLDLEVGNMAKVNLPGNLLKGLIP